MKKIYVSGELPRRFSEGFAFLRDDLGFENGPDGFPVTLSAGDRLCVQTDASSARITYHTTVECYRGLSLLREHWQKSVAIEQPAQFETLGVMFDVSRNAVLKPETLRFFFRKMALLGFHLGMMYTEDTYEVKEYPYFGYLRGKYSMQELRALDDYADALGIELCPCIQTLGHLNRALHWPAMAHMKDTEEVLLVDDPQTLSFLRSMLENATAPYRSNRIHIGMDEAHFLGQGAYLRRHGYTPPFRIMQTHLKQVGQIVRELHLDAMMWSDMYFRLSSPTGGYYDAPGIDPQIVADAPPDIGLVYWDYYHADEATYDRMLSMHEKFAAPIGFAGGIWTWTGPAPHYEKTIETSLAALRQARAHRVPLVLAAAWGDNGAECNLLTTLYGLALYAEFCYTGAYCEDDLTRRFRSVMNADAQAFLDLTRFNALPGVKDWSLRPVNAAKFLLYQDPLVPLFEADLAGVDMAAHYEGLAADYRKYQAENPEFALLMGFYTRLAEALTVKCRFHQLAGPAVRAGDRETAARCAMLAAQAKEKLEALRLAYRALWYSTNKTYGFEILDLRLGGCVARMDSAEQTMRDYAAGTVDTVASLAEEPLPYTRLPDGALRGSYAWNEIVSACKIDL